MMKKTLTAVAVASLAVGSALAACGGNDDPVAPAAGPPGSPDRLVTASALPEARGHALAPQAPRDADARYGMDRIFEASLKTALQVIALP